MGVKVRVLCRGDSQQNLPLRGVNHKYVSAEAKTKSSNLPLWSINHMAAEKKNVRSERFVSNIDDFEIKKSSKSDNNEKEDKKNDKEKKSRTESFEEYVNKSK